MKTTTKGDLGVSKVISAAILKGYKVYLPFSEDSVVDLIIERNSKLERVQVKTSNEKEKIVVKCQSTSSWACKTHKNLKYTKNDIDCIILYHIPTDNCYYIDASILGNGRSTLTLRINENKIKHKQKNIHYAKDYLAW